MVQAPRQLAFTDFYMPATAELTKELFAQEAAGAITQGLAQEGGYTAFGEQQTFGAAAAHQQAGMRRQLLHPLLSPCSLSSTAWLCQT